MDSCRDIVRDVIAQQENCFIHFLGFYYHYIHELIPLQLFCIAILILTVVRMTLAPLPVHLQANHM